MGDIVSFRKAQRRAGRDLKEKTAAQNRLLYGRSKAERTLEAARKAKADRELDFNRIKTGDER